MQDLPFTKAVRTVVEGLTSLAQRRAHDDGRILAQLSEEVSRCESRFRTLSDAARQEFEGIRNAAETELREIEEKLASKHRSSETGAELRQASELTRFLRQTEELSAKSQQDFEEAGWLADATLEATETKLAKEHDNYRRTIAATASSITGLEEQGRDLLGRFGHAPFPALEDPTLSAAQGRELDADVLRTECEDLIRKPLASLDRLRKAVNPMFASDGAIVFGGILGALAGAGLGAAFARPLSVIPIGVTAIVGLTVAIAILLPVRATLRRSVPALARSMAEELAKCRLQLEAMTARVEDRRQRLLSEARARVGGELRAARKGLDASHQLVERRRKVEEPAMRSRHSLTLGNLRSVFDAERSKEVSRVQSIVDVACRNRDETLRVVAAERDSTIAAANSRAKDETADLQRSWSSGTAELFALAARLRGQAAALCPPWRQIASEGYTPPQDLPAGIAFGSLDFDMPAAGPLPAQDDRFPMPGSPRQQLPLAIDLRSSGSVLVQASNEGRRPALDVLENLMLRLLTCLPPGKVRFTLIDPVGLGQNFAGFMHLADHDPLLVGDRIWTDMRHIEQKLTDLTEHMENVIQKYLRNEFLTIQDYNRQAGEVAEPFRFLVIADFPANFSESAVKRLVSIVASGPRCGVYTLIHADNRGRPPAWIPMADIERASLVLPWKHGQFTWSEPLMAQCPLTLEAPPDGETAKRILNDVGRTAREAGRVQVPFDMVAPTELQVWSADASSDLRVPLGRSGATKLQYLTLGRGTAQHVLIAGRTGSGKSTLLHALITNAALWYAPDELELYLVDFKKGVEFKTYATHSLPHARVIAVESEREFGLSVLRRLDAELTDRGARFRDAGVQDLGAYRHSRAGGPLPRILLIVDEFQEFFAQDDRVSQEASLLLDRLVRQGRAFGIHIVLGSQTIGGVYSLARSTIGQMAVRIALQCSEADSYLIMSEDNSAPRLLTRPGEAIYNDASGQIEGNSPFQIVWLSDEQRETHLRKIRDRLRESATRELAAPIVFEGNVPSDLARNQLLNDLLEGHTPQTPIPRAWLGEAISIKDPTAAVFRRQATENLLLVGQQDGPALALTTAIVLAAAAFDVTVQSTDKVHGPRVYILDGVAAEDGLTNPLATIAAALPTAIKRGGVRDVEPFLSALSAELDRRISAPSDECPQIFFVVHGLQRFRALRRAEDSFGFGTDSASEAGAPVQFDRLLREGPPLGIHTVLWSNTATTLERSLDRRALREFDARVLFQMSAADSTFLIDGPQAGSLGANRALHFSEETGVLEKFRPYALPSDEWLAWALGRLAGRPGARVG